MPNIRKGNYLYVLTPFLLIQVAIIIYFSISQYEKLMVTFTFLNYFLTITLIIVLWMVSGGSKISKITLVVIMNFLIYVFFYSMIIRIIPVLSKWITYSRLTLVAATFAAGISLICAFYVDKKFEKNIKSSKN